jgi:peptide deformylase
MLALDGIGLAANQVGVRARMFIMGHRENPEMAQAFFNPVVLSNTEEIEDIEEGCLSFPGIYVKVKRPKKIRVQWHDSKGEIQTDEFDGYNCKCFLHELDHLDGICFTSKVSKLKLDLAKKKQRKINGRTK